MSILTLKNIFAKQENDMLLMGKFYITKPEGDFNSVLNSLLNKIDDLDNIVLNESKNNLYVLLDLINLDSDSYDRLIENLKKISKEFSNVKVAYELAQSFVYMVESVCIIKNLSDEPYVKQKLKIAEKSELINYSFYKGNLYICFNVFNNKQNLDNYLSLLFDDFNPKKTSDLEYVKLAMALVSGFDEAKMPHDVNCTIMLEDLTLKAFAFLMIERIKNMNYINFYTLNSRLYIHSKSERFKEYCISGDEKLVEKYTPEEFRITLQNHLKKLFKIAV